MVRVEEARVDSADVDGSVGVPVDARIEDAVGRVEVDTRAQVSVRVERARIEERRLVGASTRGEATLDPRVAAGGSDERRES